MANAPQTWTMLQGLQWTIFDEVKVGGVSPFATFNAADLAKYGNNPQGNVTTAIYIGPPPKDLNSFYAYQCWIVPDVDEVAWRHHGGTVFDTFNVYVVIMGNYTTDYYTVAQTIFRIRDALLPVLFAHAEQINAPTVNDARQGQPSNDRPQGPHMRDAMNGKVFLCYGITRRMRQQWNVAGGVQP